MVFLKNRLFEITIFLVVIAIFFTVLMAAENDFSVLKEAANVSQYDGAVIKSINAKGNIGLTADEIKAGFPVKVGQRFNRKTINEALKKMFETGYYKRVAIDVEKVSGGIAINLVVDERSVIKDIVFNGNKRLSRSALMDSVRPFLKIGDGYQAQNLNEAVNAIITNYQDKGFIKAYVSPKVIEDKSKASIKIEMNIEEGNEVKIAKVRFNGNTKFSESELKRQMSTKEAGFLSLGKFNDTKFEEDKAKIIKYYKDRGYYKSRIENVRFTYQWRDPEEKSEQDLIIDIYVYEGDKYYFGDIDFKGNFVIPSATIQKGIRAKKGSLYNYSIHMTDLQTMQLLYSDRGYIFRQVIPVVKVDEENKIVNIMYDIVENEKAHVENIKIVGNTKTKDFVIERYIDIKRGEVFSSSKIQRIQERLHNTQYFDNIGIGVKPGSAEGLMELTFNVEDGRTAMISGGGGFSTSSGFKLFAELKEMNFLGRGMQLGISGEFGQNQKRFGINFADPYLFRKPVYFGVDLSYFNENVNTGAQIGTDQFGFPKYSYYTRQGFEFIFRFGYYFLDYFSTFLTFNTLVQQYQQSGNQGASSIGPSNIISDVSKYLNKKVNKKDGSFQRWESDWFTTFILSSSVLGDSRNDYLNPTKGLFGRLSADLYFGHTQLTKLSATGFWAIPATKWLSFAFYGEVGQIINSPFGPLKNDGDVLYYLNPFEDIRGWDTSLYTVFKANRGLSTYDIIGSGSSGSYTNSSSYGRGKIRFFAEFRIPIIPKTLSFAGFFDAGQLWLPRSTGVNNDGFIYPSQLTPLRDIFDPSQYMYSVGFGLRLTIPIFNIRFYVAKRFVYNKTDIGFGKGFRDFEYDRFSPLGSWLGRGWGFAFTMNHPFY